MQRLLIRYSVHIISNSAGEHDDEYDDDDYPAKRATEQAANAVYRADPEWGKRHSKLVRDIFGNPFRPVTLDPSWLTPTVIGLAQAIYQERELPSGHLDPNRLAVLADALEEAGCTDADILIHCRGPEPHVRGCWVVDALLEKS
jgi:hypothetical protein